LDLGEFTEIQLTAAARLLRSLHDATMDCDLRGISEVVCHGDPSPCNCVFVDGVPSGFIDFEAAHPGERREDLGYAAWLWLDIGNEDLAPMRQGRRLADFMAAYDSAASFDSLQLVISAQRELRSKRNCPPRTREWAEACLMWTKQHHENLLAGASARFNEAAERR
jgi:Ser/Thr protein kinase RdoA (MazF antagonist)